MIKKVGISILGLGVVGGGTYKMLAEHREFYKKIHGIDICVESVLERNRDKALSLGVEDGRIASGIAEICSNPEVDIVVETMGGIDPAKSFVLSCLNAGKSVVTSNKELYCKFGYELEKTAKKNNCGLFYEATCVGGVPVIRSLLDSLQGNYITSVMGIINGTTNYILSKITESGESYETVLMEAQRLGYAEADPTADVEGYDAQYKLSILSSIAFHTKVPYTEVYREGISGITPLDISYAKKLGYTVKLLAIGKNGTKGIEARVHPAFIKSTHPLAGVSENNNAVYITGDNVQDVMLYGRGAGAGPTASAIVGDIIFCATHSEFKYSPFCNTEKADSSTKFISNFESAYYIRLEAEDKTGVLAKLTSVLSKCGISVAQIIQENNAEGAVPVVIVTHLTHESAVNKAVAEINAISGVTKVASVIRVVS